MKSSALRALRAPLSVYTSLSMAAVSGLLLASSVQALGQGTELDHVAPPRLVRPIDDHAIVTLKNSVRRDAGLAPDLGLVEDSREMHLYLVLQRTPEQQADLENLLERQQQPGAAEYHKWLTPRQFGARFGAAPADIAKINAWLESHGFQVRSVLNNASMIDFAATAGQVREAFHTQLHYVSVRGGRYAALRQDPSIPAALAPLVAGIKGLNKIPAYTNHTEPRQYSYDKETHAWHAVNPTAAEAASPAYSAGGGTYNVAPGDLYTIYNINPMFTAGTLGSTANVAVIEESDIEYGTVNSTSHVATGGDVATFRTLFGVPGTLNLHVYHGYGTVTCNDPGIDPSGNGEDGEASLDAEWINATAPSANEIFMSCDNTVDNGIFSSIAALVDNNISDVMSMSYGETEINYTTADYNSQDTLYAQAAAQGQSFFVSAGDSGSDVADQNTAGTATSGINVSAFASPLTTVTGGTDFQDLYDSSEGGPAQSTYWSSTNTSHFSDAIKYVPEMPWNQSCASSIYAKYAGYTGAGFCATGTATNSSVVGGSGGISTHYAAPSWQTGISGYSNAKHAQPDIAGFASDGFWGHGLIFCDSNPSLGGADDCSSSSTFGEAGGTSFVAPYMAGVAGLLVNYTGARQGLLNPTLYALGKAQYTAAATKTACYANGQTNNTGVTTGAPAAACIFNDVTTGNNDVPCAAGATSCYVNSGASFGMLSLTGSGSLSVAYPSTIGFDQTTGIGSVNVTQLLTQWNTAFTSAAALSASPTSISSSQTTTLKATVTTGTPVGYDGTKPATTGTITFKTATKTLGTCTLSAGACSLSVAGSALASGANSITANYGGSGTYPSSASTAATVTVTSTSSTPATMTSPAPGSTLTGSSTTFSWTAGTGVAQYTLHIGTTGVGSTNISTPGSLTTTSYTVTGIPTTGATLYVRLYSFIAGAWQYIDYTYTEASAATKAVMSTPAPGSTLTGSTVKFTWTPGSQVTQYTIHVGTTGVGSNNIGSPSSSLTTTSYTYTNIPTTGATLYVRLYSFIAGAWQYSDYTYTEASAAAKAAMTTPAPSSTLTGSSVTFTWTAGSQVTQYTLHVGTTGVGSTNISAPGSLTTTSYTVTGIPTTGGTVYVRLYSFIAGAWQYTDYTYTASTSSGCTDTILCNILSETNTIRADGSFGPGNPPPSSEPGGALVPLTWSATAASNAQAWAAQCNFSHNPDLGSMGLGENIYASGSSGPPPVTVTGTDVVDSWAAEAANYTYSTNACASGQTCGHYTQLVWRATTGVGCAVQQCSTNSPFGASFPNWAFAVCDYTPAGNLNGQKPY